MQYLRRGAYEKLTMAICLLWLYAYDGVTMASYDLYCLLFCDTSLYLHTMHIDGSYTSMAVLTSYVRPMAGRPPSQRSYPACGKRVAARAAELTRCLLDAY